MNNMLTIAACLLNVYTFPGRCPYPSLALRLGSEI